MRNEFPQTLFVDPDDPTMKARLDALPPIEGMCVFVDLSGSTKMKTIQERTRWILALSNFFNVAQVFSGGYRPPLKLLGDEAMYFLPLNAAEMSGSPGSLLLGLCELLRDPPPMTWKEGETLARAEIRIGVTLCRETLGISFQKGRPDVYGTEVDLAARLVGKALPGQIVMDASFFRNLQDDPSSNVQDRVKQIEGPTAEFVKGLGVLNLYRWAVSPRKIREW